jgi:GH15 family glucan-1,4-alpha-glucosidase
MAKLRGDRVAFGWPGLEPRWTQANKDGVGTAYATDSRVWYTIGDGILTEIYYPTIDSPQTRDLQYLITDGKRFVTERIAISIQKSNACHAKALVTALPHLIQQDAMSSAKRFYPTCPA